MSRPAHRAERSPRWQSVLTVAALVAFPLLYGVVALHRGQDADWDLRNYHLFDPFWVFVDHQRDAIPAQLQTFLNPLADVPFYWGARHLSARTVAYIIAVVEGLSFPILYGICRFFTGRRLLALGAAGLGMFTAGALSEIGNVMGDALLAPFVLAGILLGLHACTSPPTAAGRRLLLVAGSAGLLSGIGAGLKLSLMPFTAATVVAFLVVAQPVRRRLLLAAGGAGGVLVGLAASYGWWAYELDVHWGNPFLPYFNKVFKSPYAPLATNNDARFLPHGVLHAVFYPFYWAVHPLQVSPEAFRELTIPALELVVLLLVVKAVAVSVRARRWRPLFASDAERYLVVVAVASYLLWILVFSIYRYLIPLEMLAVIVLGVCVRRLVAPLRPWPVAVVAMAVVVAASLATEKTIALGRTPWAPSVASVSVPAGIGTAPVAFLMIGANPDAYAVPYFPTSDYFARIEGNLKPTPAMRSRIMDAPRSYDRVYLFWSDPTRYKSDAALLHQRHPSWARYGFKVDPSQCFDIPAVVGSAPQSLHACALVRT